MLPPGPFTHSSRTAPATWRALRTQSRRTWQGREKLDEAGGQLIGVCEVAPAQAAQAGDAHAGGGEVAQVGGQAGRHKRGGLVGGVDRGVGRVERQVGLDKGRLERAHDRTGARGAETVAAGGCGWCERELFVLAS